MKHATHLRRLFAAALLLAGLALVVAGCADISVAPTMDVPGGDPQTGADLIEQWGCGSCHTIPGIVKANGLVGPPLTNFASRAYIAGNLTNNPANLIRWIMDPQEVEPGTAMPDLNVSEGVARHMAAYIYALGGDR